MWIKNQKGLWLFYNIFVSGLELNDQILLKSIVNQSKSEAIWGSGFFLFFSLCLLQSILGLP